MDTNEMKHHLNMLSAQFERVVDAVDIYRWLGNFEEEDRDTALGVLTRMTYYSSNRIYSTLRMHIEELVSEHPGCYFCLTPVREEGKSGTLATYYVKHIFDEEFPDVQCKRLDKYQMTNDTTENVCWVLIDDFSGTGDTVLRYVDNLGGKIKPEWKKTVLLVACMEEAREALENIDLKVYADSHAKVFARRGSPFGYPEKMLKYRDFAYKYGELLDFEGKVDMRPLGYKNSQALISFGHTTPNNTLPILWCRKRKDGGNWIPLFPRYIDDRIKFEKQYQGTKSYWVSIARKLSMSTYAELQSTTNEQIQMLSLLRLMRQGKTLLAIGQSMGIGWSELKSILELGKQYGLIDNSGQMTGRAEVFIQDCYKKIRMQQAKDEEYIYTEDIMYVPVEKSETNAEV